MDKGSNPLTRRQAFALAAALALTVVTGGAAVTGLRHMPAPHTGQAQWCRWPRQRLLAGAVPSADGEAD